MTPTRNLPNEIAELRHRDASKRERRRVVAQGEGAAPYAEPAAAGWPPAHGSTRCIVVMLS